MTKISSISSYHVVTKSYFQLISRKNLVRVGENFCFVLTVHDFFLKWDKSLIDLVTYLTLTIHISNTVELAKYLRRNVKPSFWSLVRIEGWTLFSAKIFTYRNFVKLSPYSKNCPLTCTKFETLFSRLVKKKFVNLSLYLDKFWDTF